MSAAPTPYTPTNNFATIAVNPIVEAGLPGAAMDAEFIAISETTGGLISRLGQLQRADGALAAGVVNRASLSTEIMTGVKPPTQWAVLTDYLSQDSVTFNGQWYWCLEDHTSGADFDLTKWQVLAAPFSNQDAIDMISQYAAQGITAGFARWTATGTGSAQTFPLTAGGIFPTINASAAYIVTVNGLIKDPVTYTISVSAKTIFFVAPPSSGAVIVIVMIGYPRATISGSITNDQLADDIISQAKMQDASVGTAELIDSNATNAKLANMANQTLKGRKAGTTGAPEDITINDALNFLSTTRGDIIYRGSAGWAALSAGTSGQILKTNGAGLDPAWVTAGSNAQTGQVLVNNTQRTASGFSITSTISPASAVTSSSGTQLFNLGIGPVNPASDKIRIRAIIPYRMGSTADVPVVVCSMTATDGGTTYNGTAEATVGNYTIAAQFGIINATFEMTPPHNSSTTSNFTVRIGLGTVSGNTILVNYRDATNAGAFSSAQFAYLILEELKA